MAAATAVAVLVAEVAAVALITVAEEEVARTAEAAEAAGMHLPAEALADTAKKC
jgi:hypothetical protein